MMDIPYWSMIPAFTQGGKEREGSVHARDVPAPVWALQSSPSSPCIVSNALGRRRRASRLFTWFALIIAVLFVVFIAITCLNIKEKSTVDVEAPSIGQMFKALIQNDQAMAVVITIVLINCVGLHHLQPGNLLSSNTILAEIPGTMPIHCSIPSAERYRFLSMMLLFPLLRKFLSTIRIFYVSFADGDCRIFSAAGACIYNNVQCIYTVYSGIFHLCGKRHVTGAYNHFPCQYRGLW